jgi:hypothetical protein
VSKHDDEVRIRGHIRSVFPPGRCAECGANNLPPVSLFRCSMHPNEHQAVGPAIEDDLLHAPPPWREVLEHVRNELRAIRVLTRNVTRNGSEAWNAANDSIARIDALLGNEETTS